MSSCVVDVPESQRGAMSTNSTPGIVRSAACSTTAVAGWLMQSHTRILEACAIGAMRMKVSKSPQARMIM
jgi:hypothetical protein